MIQKDQVIGRIYKIICQLGSGGMGQVFRATDLNLHRDVAIKFLSPDASQDQGLIDRFLNEGRVLATIRHRAVIDIYASDVDPELKMPFLVMELVDGHSLEQIKDGLANDLNKSLEIIVELLQGIHACHQKNIIHRDIKPANILINREGQLKIVDFGIAKTAKKVTRTGISMGTPHYMSPEQCMGKGDISAKADVYSIGVMFWEFLTGKVPFDVARDADDPGLAIALKHLSEPPPLQELGQSPNGAKFQDLLKAMLAKKPDDRPTIPDILLVLSREMAKAGKTTASASGGHQGMIDETYRIEKELGSGGMGKVYQALDLSLNRTVAIKVLHESISVDETVVDRFIKEGQLLATVGHPNVLNIFASARDRNTSQPFLVMEFIDGKLLSDLKSALMKNPEQIAPIMLQLVEGMQACHAKGIIHRDLKPSNVMVTRDGLLKIFDFGIAKTDKSVTKTGMTVGTPIYMSPEQCMGSKDITTQSDIYSLGVIFWEFVYGTPPFKAEDETNPELSVAIQHVQATLPMVALPKNELFLPALPIIRQMLNKVPASRPKLEEIAEFLEGFIAATVPQDASGQSTRRRRDSMRRSSIMTVMDLEQGSSWKKAAAAGIVLLLLAGGGWWFTQRPGSGVNQQYIQLSKKITEEIKNKQFDQAAKDVELLGQVPEAALLAESFRVSLSVEFEQQGRVAKAAGKDAEARDLFRKAVDFDPENASAAADLHLLEDIELQRQQALERRQNRLAAAEALFDGLTPASGTDELAAIITECKKDEQATQADELEKRWVGQFLKSGQDVLEKDPTLAMKYFGELERRFGKTAELSESIAKAEARQKVIEAQLAGNREIASLTAEIRAQLQAFSGSADPAPMLDLLNRLAALAGTGSADQFRKDLAGKIAGEGDRLLASDKGAAIVFFRRAQGISTDIEGLKDKIRKTEDGITADRAAAELAARETAFLTSLDERIAALKPGDDPLAIISDCTRLGSEFGKPDAAAARKAKLFEIYCGRAAEMKDSDPVKSLEILKQCRIILPERTDIQAQVTAMEEAVGKMEVNTRRKQELQGKIAKLAKKPLAKNSAELPAALAELEKLGDKTTVETVRAEIARELEAQAEKAGGLAEATTLLNGILQFIPEDHPKRAEFAARVQGLVDGRRKTLLADLAAFIDQFKPTPDPKALLARLDELDKMGEKELRQKQIETVKGKYQEAVGKLEEKDPLKARDLLNGMLKLPGVAADPEVKQQLERLDKAARIADLGQKLERLVKLETPTTAQVKEIISLSGRYGELGKADEAKAFRAKAADGLVQAGKSQLAKKGFDKAVDLFGYALDLVPDHREAQKAKTEADKAKVEAQAAEAEKAEAEKAEAAKAEAAAAEAAKAKAAAEKAAAEKARAEAAEAEKAAAQKAAAEKAAAEKAAAEKARAAEFVVGAGGTYADIASALEKAPEGTVIKIKPGKYPGPITLSKKVTLQGEGERSAIVIEGKGGPAIVIDGGATVANLTFRGTSGDIVKLTGGSPTVKNCAVTGPNAASGPDWPGAIAVTGGSPVISGNTISNSKGMGVAVKSGSPKVTGNTMSGCGVYGIWFTDGAKGTADGNTISNSGKSGIGVKAGAAPAITGNTVKNNGENGVLVYQDGHGVIRNNDLSGNGKSGIMVFQGGRVERIEGNTFNGNREHGVHVLDGFAKVGANSGSQGSSIHKDRGSQVENL